MPHSIIDTNVLKIYEELYYHTTEIVDKKRIIEEHENTIKTLIKKLEF